jgi:hypothetical protein
MDKWQKVSIAMMAALLAGAGAFQQFAIVPFGAERARPDAENAASPVDELRPAPEYQRSAMVGCQEAANMLYAVHWAVACQAQAGQASPGLAEGDAECDLPEAKAAVINAWLDEAEQRCRAEVRAGLSP